MKADSPLPNPWDELQGSQREKQQSWNNVEQRDPRVLDIANVECIRRWRFLGHERETNRPGNKEDDHEKHDCNPS